MSKTKLIGRLMLDNNVLFKELQLIEAFPAIHNEAYSEFGNGTRQNYSLWNESGDYKKTQYTDFESKIKITELGLQLNYINKLIGLNFDTPHLKMVRAKNLINGMVVPHKDFVELSKNSANYVRVFIPLEDNYFAFHSDENNVFRMRKGEIWILDASIVHAAINFSPESRQFLCLNFQYDSAVQCPSVIFKDKALYRTNLEACIINRTTKQDVFSNLKQLSRIICEKNYKDILIQLSKLHFFYEFDICDTYDWLITTAQMADNKKLTEKMKQLKTFMIKDRKPNEKFSFP